MPCENFHHIVQDYVPGLTVASILRLEASGGEQETELVVVTLISTTLQEILNMRIAKTNIRRNVNINMQKSLLRRLRSS